MMFSTLILVSMVTGILGRFPDWLVNKMDNPALVTKTTHGTLKLTNGLMTREFSMQPGFATVDYYSHEFKSSLLRAISPEAKISLDGVVYNVGGFKANIPRAYMNRTALHQNMQPDPNAFQMYRYDVGKPIALYDYKPKRYIPVGVSWPPKGVRLEVFFKAPASALVTHSEVTVAINYELYDNHPILVKWVSVTAPPGLRDTIEVGVLSVEYLSLNQQWADTDKWLYVQTDAAHGYRVSWGKDPEQPKMPGSFQPILNCSFALTPFVPIGDKGFVSFRVQEIVLGPANKERSGLALRKMLRLLAPQTQESPLFFHAMKGSTADIKFTIDQLSEVGFDILVYSFGSGFNVESTDEKYMDEVAAMVAYAKSKGIEVGAYDFPIALTRVTKKEWMAVNPGTTHSACFASDWADVLLKQYIHFFNRTGLAYIEPDGPYDGYYCHSTNHSHHRGYQDSMWMQEKIQSEFFRTLMSMGIYVDAPDYYFYQGISKIPIGYNENQFSLPRWQDLSVSRQSLYDDTFHYAPTTGFMFVPLVDYHSGGAAAAFEPFSDNMVAYEWVLATYLGAGTQSCMRGYRLYDSPATKQLVIKWVQFFKKYRDILISDLIHVRRADMQGIDCFVHVNPFLPINGLAMVFNPTEQKQTTNLTIPLYYTGLTTVATVKQEDGNPVKYSLERDYTVDITVELAPLGITWYTIQ